MYVAWAPFFSGAERALIVLLENLDPERYRPRVVLGTDGQLADELRSRGIDTTYIPLVNRGLRELPSWLRSVSRLALHARRTNATIVHSNDVPSFQPAGYAARLVGLPAVTHVRFPDTRQGFAWFLKPGFRRALFVSGDLRDDAVRVAPDVFANCSDVVHDGVEVPPVASEDERRRLRDELGLPHDRAIVVMAGQVAEIKGIWDYIAAAALVAERHLPVLFVVLGDDMRNNGALRIQAEREVQARGLSDVVRFLGFRPDARRLIPAFDIVAVPSHVEPLGNATLEAMATARPVVGSRVGGIPEMVQEGLTGLLVPSKDPARLADAIEVLVRDPEKARTYGLAGRARALQEFSVRAHATRVQATYDRVLGRSNGSERAS